LPVLTANAASHPHHLIFQLLHTLEERPSPTPAPSSAAALAKALRFRLRKYATTFPLVRKRGGPIPRAKAPELNLQTLRAIADSRRTEEALVSGPSSPCSSAVTKGCRKRHQDPGGDSQNVLSLAGPIPGSGAFASPVLFWEVWVQKNIKR
jgi:hypothetical protein